MKNDFQYPNCSDTKEIFHKKCSKSDCFHGLILIFKREFLEKHSNSWIAAEADFSLCQDYQYSHVEIRFCDFDSSYHKFLFVFFPWQV